MSPLPMFDLQIKIFADGADRAGILEQLGVLIKS